ncbi:PhoX family protein [Kushneria phosphatilytica]|uniref:PhoX family phosphatase n=1 Tax=Kushneria phosphatilytica TaxID=657387 RepID=A0A1S1NTM2_9GAMM|nr:PhoX family phosphatase [Kushneria phosphatilytica]OHV10491.1 dTDP-glucose 4,6-dehydratase [Kushneria phosphatilytica]QEL11955.1 PhoX family phosphatase [Kushneria phosphatilytica]
MSAEIENHDNHNLSRNTPFSTILDRRMSRRRVMQGGLGVAAATLFAGFGLPGAVRAATAAASGQSLSLGFESIPGSMTDAVVVPPGYRAQVLIPWGTPLTTDGTAWSPDLSLTPELQARATGMHHDGMYHFPLDPEQASSDFLLVVNHEYIDQSALWAPSNGATNPKQGARPADEVRTEINAHGVSVVRIRRDADGHWAPVTGDRHNRRFTSATSMELAGPVRGSEMVMTAWSPDGTRVRGTNNNCACGHTPWGTYLTCEENWPEVFTNSGERTADQKRLGMPTGRGRYGWETAEQGQEGEFSRFDNTPRGASAREDYRNEARAFGYVVEIDPYDSDSRAYKRTALGRFRHEGCWPGRVVEGEPLAFYTGHDARNEYIYKFVSKKRWDARDANRPGEHYDRQSIGASYLDEGTLHVARFNEDGSGDWLALTPESEIPGGGPNGERTLGEVFGDQAGIIINTCDAADLLGATPMDRPEWGTVDPGSGDVYMSLTNNSDRTAQDTEPTFTDGAAGLGALGAGFDTAPVNAANPRPDNNFGQVMRWRETDRANRFEWEVFLFGAPAGAGNEINRSGLTEANEFASPDGLWFDERGENGEGILWIETDNGIDKGRDNAVAQATNDQVLAIVPGALARGDTRQTGQQLRRFAVGPNACEVTGIFATPDRTALFINIQHPGNWPASDDATQVTKGQVRPRAATVVIQKEDGGPVGV